MMTFSVSLAHVTWPLACMWMAHKAIAAWERQSAVTPSSHDDPAAIPEDLMALVMTYPDGWAQEDVLKVIRERYEDLRDWNRVRAVMGIGVISSQS